MSLTIITSDGQEIVAEDGPPYQYTDEGFNTWLSENSTPLSEWGASTPTSYRGLYETQPWVAATINFLTRQVARLPLKTYELDSQNTKKRVKEGRLHDLITKPAPRCGPVHLKQWLAFPTLLHGNSATRKIRDRPGGTPIGLRPTYWPTLEAKQEDNEPDGELQYWINRERRKPKVLDPDDLIHIAWMAPRGLFGVSPLKQLGVTMRIERAAQSYQENAFRNNVNPSGAVQMPDGIVLDDDIRKEIRKDLARWAAGTKNARRPILLPGGMKWESISHTAHEAELIDQRKVAREETAAVYNAPQPLIGILDHATYSNIAELHKILYGPVLGPWLVLFEESFKSQVIDDEPAFEGQWVEFDLREVLRGDPLKEAQALKAQVQSGLLTINEARQIMNLQPIDHPDCDRPMVPVNNIAFVGGTDIDKKMAASRAVHRNIARAGDRVYRKTKAGDSDGWDPERFERELVEDLRAAEANDPESSAAAWTRALTAVVDDAIRDPDELKRSFDALQFDLETETA